MEAGPIAGIPALAVAILLTSTALKRTDFGEDEIDNFITLIWNPFFLRRLE